MNGRRSRFRSLWIAGVLALVVVGVATLMANRWVEGFERRDAELAEGFRRRADQLRALDERFPFRPRKTLDEGRMPAYLAVREQTVGLFRARLEERSSEQLFHALKTRNEVLGTLARGLAVQRMSLTEYMAMASRWQALLARGDRLGLLGEWKRVVRSKQHPDGLPLPDPARDATSAELALFRRNEKALEKTLRADLLGPTLERIIRASR